MTPARGDSKPCSRAQCPGTMQFGREPLPRTASGMTVDGDRGWVCSSTPDHFQRASEDAHAPAVSATSNARWADDGGARR